MRVLYIQYPGSENKQGGKKTKNVDWLLSAYDASTNTIT